MQTENKPVIGFFGDAMQAIYNGGIGELDALTNSGKLTPIEKEDNYRCSEQVISFINALRNDDFSQAVALKSFNGKQESINDRQGKVEFFYSVVDEKPHAFSTDEQKNKYRSVLEELIKKVTFEEESKTLLLTNSAVSINAGFPRLFKIFSDYYVEPKEKIDQFLKRLQLIDLCEICNAFTAQNYNLILAKLKSNGVSIKSVADKKRLSEIIKKIINSDDGAIETVIKALENKILKKSDSFEELLNRIKNSLIEHEQNENLKLFEINFNNDGHTFLKMLKIDPQIDEDTFNEQKRYLEQKHFYKELLSTRFSFSEVINYLRYEEEKTPFITMHKTQRNWDRQCASCTRRVLLE